VNFVGMLTLTIFLSFLKDKAFSMRVWFKSQSTPSPLDIRHVGNVRGLFEAFRAEYALLHDHSVHELIFAATIANDKIMRRDMLVLTNCWVACGAPDLNSKEIIDGKSPFEIIPQLLVEPLIQKGVIPSGVVPMFKSLPNRETSLSRDYERIDGELANLVCSLHMDVVIPEWSLKLNGSAIICHMIDYFG
jgi:hypothetical protein